MKKLYVLVALMGCFGLQLSWAQQKSISGTVFDETGGPLPGATIKVEGSSRGVATDFDGNFSIEVSEGETLLVTYVGYADQRITIGTADSYSITLTADNELEEVVVTSLGIQREKQALGYAISEVDEASIEQRAKGDIGRVLSGKASGVQITNQSGISGSGTSIIIRGFKFFNGCNMKIYYKIFFLLMSATLIISCSKKEGTIENEEMTIAEEVITDPLNSTLNEQNTLEDYWGVFRKDAIRSGRLDPGLNKSVNLFFGNEPDFASGVTTDHAGRAYSICRDDEVSFEIIKSFWEDYTIVQRLYVFYHEAGHARYNFRHPCETDEVCSIDSSDLPIMWRAAFAGNNNNFKEFIEDKKIFLQDVGMG